MSLIRIKYYYIWCFEKRIKNKIGKIITLVTFNNKIIFQFKKYFKFQNFLKIKIQILNLQGGGGGGRGWDLRTKAPNPYF